MVVLLSSHIRNALRLNLDGLLRSEGSRERFAGSDVAETIHR